MAVLQGRMVASTGGRQDGGLADGNLLLASRRWPRQWLAQSISVGFSRSFILGNLGLLLKLFQRFLNR